MDVFLYTYTVSEGSDEAELPWLIQRCPRDDIKTRHGIFDVPGEGNSAWNRGRKSLPVQREGCLLLVVNEKLHSVLGRVVCVYAGRQEPSAGLILHKNLKKGTLRVAAFAVVFDKVRLVELVRLSDSN